MKHLLIGLLLFLSLKSFSQPTFGFEIGGYEFADRQKIMYLDKTVSWGGNIGAHVSFPILKKKMALQTGLSFCDDYYKLRGPNFKVWFSDEYFSGFSIHKNVNSIGLNLPITLAWNKGRIQPFIGVDFKQSLLKNNVYIQSLGNIGVGNPMFFYAKGEDLIDLSEFNWYLHGGFYFVCSPKAKIKIQYTRGINNFVTHTISPKIINGVNLGTTVQHSQIDRFQVAFVYYPSWKKKMEGNKKTKRSFKDAIKTLYQ
jgi:hypothetical protein